MSQKILIIEDEEGIVHLLRLYLKDAGYDVIAAHDGADGLALHAREHPDLVILFSPRELLSRVRAILRRTDDREAGGVQAAPGARDQKAVLRFPGLTVDMPARRVEVNGSEVALTPTEFDLLALLAQSPDR